MIDIEGVEFSGLPALDDVDSSILKSEIERFLGKVSFGDDIRLHLNFKEHRHFGLKVKHEVHARLSVGGHPFFASDSDWQLLKTVQKVLDHLKREVFRKFGKS